MIYAAFVDIGTYMMPFIGFAVGYWFGWIGGHKRGLYEGGGEHD